MYAAEDKKEAETRGQVQVLLLENSSSQNEATNVIMAARGGVPGIVAAAGYLYYHWWRDNAGEIGSSMSTMAPNLGGLLTHYLMSKKSGKEKANDIPSWAAGKKPNPGESGKDFAERLLNEWYGPGNWSGTGPGSEYNKLKKNGDRNK